MDHARGAAKPCNAQQRPFKLQRAREHEQRLLGDRNGDDEQVEQVPPLREVVGQAVRAELEQGLDDQSAFPKLDDN